MVKEPHESLSKSIGVDIQADLTLGSFSKKMVSRVIVVLINQYYFVS